MRRTMRFSVRKPLLRPRPVADGPTRQLLRIARKSPMLVASAAVSLTLLAYTPSAHGFAQKAVDQLIEKRECLRCDLRGADLSHKRLRGVNLSGAYLIGANLETADMRDANLSGAWLNGANLQHANLTGSSLHGAHLIDADLTDANLGKVDLRNSMMARAKLAKASLHEADLSGVKMQGTNLRGARNLKQDQLSTSCGDANTLLPQGVSIRHCSGRTQ